LVVATNGTTVINTHLDASATDTYRLQEVASLAQLAGKYHGSLILGGDLNSTPDSPVHPPLRAQGLRDAWAECGSGEELTYPAASPVKRIDYLLLSAPHECTSATVLDSAASDHRPVLVVVRARD
jgi:endonuclease/exonuclease/phosphatase (EEP) superfamily protein YafD